MKIGFVGYGSMAIALGSKWASEHDLFFGGRDPAKAKAVALSVTAKAAAGTEREAVAFGDVIVLATRHGHVFSAIEAAGGAASFAGKTVIDINNPVSVDTFLMQPMGGPSLGQAIQVRLPDARVVKAFNACQAKVWEMADPVFDGRRLVVPICGDSEDAKAVVGELVRMVGCDVLDVGGLQFAPHLEHHAAIVIKQLFAGADALSVFNWITPE